MTWPHAWLGAAYALIVVAPPTKTLFWRTFSAAFVCYAVTVLVLSAVYLDAVALVALLLPALVRSAFGQSKRCGVPRSGSWWSSLGAR